MKRSDFLKALAAVIVAPSILVSLPETNNREDIPDPHLYEPSTVTSAGRGINAFSWKISSCEVQDTDHMRYLLTNPSSNFWREAQRAGIDLTKPYEMSLGWVADDFIHDVQTIVVRQKPAA